MFAVLWSFCFCGECFCWKKYEFCFSPERLRRSQNGEGFGYDDWMYPNEWSTDQILIDLCLFAAFCFDLYRLNMRYKFQFESSAFDVRCIQCFIGWNRHFPRAPDTYLSRHCHSYCWGVGRPLLCSKQKSKDIDLRSTEVSRLSNRKRYEIPKYVNQQTIWNLSPSAPKPVNHSILDL